MDVTSIIFKNISSFIVQFPGISIVLEDIDFFKSCELYNIKTLSYVVNFRNNDIQSKFEEILYINYP